MARQSPTVRVHPDFARRLKTIQRAAVRDLGREVTSAELTGMLAALDQLRDWPALKSATLGVQLTGLTTAGELR